uniref:Uncharacterized protein n=1 Tax=Romanomermis culicivorax TaxID=13658 RepID=A0A915IQS9_ROMCU
MDMRDCENLNLDGDQLRPRKSERGPHREIRASSKHSITRKKILAEKGKGREVKEAETIGQEKSYNNGNINKAKKTKVKRGRRKMLQMMVTTKMAKFFASPFR